MAALGLLALTVDVQNADMRGIEASFHHVQEIAGKVDANDHALRRRNLHIFEATERRFLAGWAKIDPDHVARLARRIGFRPVAPQQPRVVRVRHFEDRAVDRKRPAVQETTDAAIFHAAEGERRATVAAGVIQHADPSAAVPEGDVVFTEHREAARRGIRLRQVRRQQNRLPIAPHHLGHRRAGADAA